MEEGHTRIRPCKSQVMDMPALTRRLAISDREPEMIEQGYLCRRMHRCTWTYQERPPAGLVLDITWRAEVMPASPLESASANDNA
jgi:hypothetical protein